MFTLSDLQNKVEKLISEYLEFDINEMFQQSDYITIYGGAVRDALANTEIHDVDILCMPDSAHTLRRFIKKYNYEMLELYDQDTLNMYNGISLISEPWTFMNKNKKIIQIIRPTWKSNYNGEYPTTVFDDYKIAYHNLIKNVDISSCGVFLENFGKNGIKLKEACKDAIIHCLSKTYTINEWANLYRKERTMYRENKLNNRGWINLNCPKYPNDHWMDFSIGKKHNKIILKRERFLKICNLEFKPEYDYKVWTENDYLNRKTVYLPNFL